MLNLSRRFDGFTLKLHLIMSDNCDTLSEYN